MKFTSAEKTNGIEKKPFQIESPHRLYIPMLLLVIILVCFGLIMLFSASMPIGAKSEGNPLFYVLKQGAFNLIGILIATIVIFIPVRFYDRIGFVFFAYAVMLGLVVYTKFAGRIIGGSRRWIIIAGQSFQPSELAKIALVFCIAGYRSFIIRQRKKGRLVSKDPKHQHIMDTFYDIVLPALSILVVLFVVLMQPHMSCFIIMSLIAFCCFIVSGISIRSWIEGGVFILALLLVFGSLAFLVSSNSQKADLKSNFAHVFNRINIFEAMNSDESDSTSTDTTEATTEDAIVDVTGTSDSAAIETTETTSESEDVDVYQSRQSMIAVGSGGMTGVGFGSSRQKYRYLPEAHNDYVYAIACEELGFVGGVSIIVLFWAFFVGGLSIAWRTKSDFARILAVGYTCLITLQAFLNIGVAIGVIPPTGITLPFFSYGGTANLFFLIATGLILAVSRTGVKQKAITFID